MITTAVIYTAGCIAALYWSRGTVWNADRIAAIFLWPVFALVWTAFLIGVSFFNVGNWR